MDKIANVKSQLRLQQWAQIISDCQASDMTVVAWCEANNINIKSYYYWLRKVRNHTLEQMPELTENLPATTEDTPVTFKKLDIQTPVTETAAAVIIRLPNATVEVSEGTSQQTVQAVLMALQAVC